MKTNQQRMTFNTETFSSNIPTYIKSIFKSVYWLISTLFIYSCAQVVSPGGGPKDIKPPVALKYVPDSATVNFKSKEITIYFDEFIQLKDISQLVVSPPLEKSLGVKAKNKELRIEFDESLKDSTTYSIHFGNAIADITEGNAAENFKYIFSTGTFIDSISFTGKVDDAFDHKTEKGVLVMLYDRTDDSVPYKERPKYFGKTREDGSFKIDNIKSGKYKLVALKDVNSNYLYDSPEENIGFLNDPLDIQKDTSFNFSLFKELPQKQFLRKAAALEYGHFMLVFNKPVERLNIAPLNFTAKREWYTEEYSTNKDTVHYWLMGVNSMDTLKLQITDEDKILDTVAIKTLPQKQTGGRGSKFELRIKTNLNTPMLDLNDKILLEFNHPIHKYDFSKVSIVVDSVIRLSKNDLEDKLVLRQLSISPVKKDTISKTKMQKQTWQESAAYSLFIPPATFTDMFDLSNDSFKLDFKTQELKYYGTLKLKLTIPKADQPYIIQLLDDKNKVVRENFLDDNGTIDYEYLHPGAYKLKLIYDENKNRKWDTGNYLKKVQPEKTMYFSSPIEIRSNWDIEQEWKAE